MKKRSTVILECVLALLLFMSGTVLHAAGKVPAAKDVLNNMQRVLSGMETAEFTFSFKAYGESGDLVADESGNFVAQGDCFRLASGSVEVYCDGRAKWIYDKENTEITVFPHDSLSSDPAENPFAALVRTDPALYSFRGGVDVTDRDGVRIYSFTMVPKDNRAPYREICISVDASTWLPAEAGYVGRGGDVYELHIGRVKSVQRKNHDFFVPSEELLDNPDVYVTDMRD